MNLTPDQRRKIEATLSISELDNAKPLYDRVTLIKGDTGGLTYGKFQTTLNSGNLYTLIGMYANTEGKYSKDLVPYLTKLKQHNASLNTDMTFRNLLKKAGSDPVMQQTQDEFFNRIYWTPAERWADMNGFKEALSMAIIFDSFIHSGTVPMWLRLRFPALTPAKGGNEKDWILQYTKARHNWLANHARQDLRNSSYRTRELLALIKTGNWELKSPLTFRGHQL